MRWLRVAASTAVLVASASALTGVEGCRQARPEVESSVDQVLEQAASLMRSAEFARATEVIEEAEQAAAQRQDRLAQTRLMAKRAEILANSGAIGRSKTLFERASQQFLSRPEPRWQTQGMVVRGQLRVVSGDADGAWEDYAQASRAYRRLGLAEEAVKLDAERAVTGSRQGRFEEALRLGLRAAGELEMLGLKHSRDRALTGVAWSLDRLGREAAAAAAYDQLIASAGDRNDQLTLLFAYCNRAELRRRSEEVEPAEEELRWVLEGFESSRAELIVLADEKASYLARQVSAYESLILLLADSYRGLDGFEVAERFHARSFLELLSRRDLDRAVRADPALRRHERRLLEQLGAARLVFEQSPGVTPDQPRQEVERLEIELAEIRAEIQHRDPGYSRLADPQPPSLPEVQSALRPGEAMVSFWVAEDRLLAWSLTRTEALVTQVPVGRQQLTREVMAYLEQLRSPRRAEDAALEGREDAHLAVGRRLYDWLYAPLPSVVRAADTLIVIPDDVLFYLPLESLPSDCAPVQADGGIHSAYRGCRFLGVNKSIAYNPSAGVLLSLRNRPSASGGRSATGMFALAPRFESERPTAPAELRGALSRLAPLRHAEGEVQRIAALFERAEVLVDREATETRFKAEVKDHRFIHLATHGLVTDSLPMTSGLLLATGDADDGLLQAYEVLGLDLDADLVTLSACRSGRGQLHRGEGIVGLSQAFLYAGADSVLVSMWDVDDRSTPLLMEAFYRRLAAGTGRAESLRLARAEVFDRMGEGRLVFKPRPLAYAHPRFWAPFVLIGDPGR